MPRPLSYTVYPKWFGGFENARAAMAELGRSTADYRGWTFGGLTMTPDGFDDRGERYIATVDYRNRLC
jgi:hypothetical protein